MACFFANPCVLYKTMPIGTLRKAAEKFGLSSEDRVRYYVKGDKGIIEVDIDASEREIEQSAVNDSCEDFLPEDELEYYLSLEDL